MRVGSKFVMTKRYQIVVPRGTVANVVCRARDRSVPLFEGYPKFGKGIILSKSRTQRDAGAIVYRKIWKEQWGRSR